MSAPLFADIHYDAGLLAGLLEGLAELHNENQRSDAVIALIETTCRFSKALVEDIEAVMGAHGKGGDA